MGIFDGVRNFFRPAERKNAGLMVSTWQDNQPQYSKTDFLRLSQNGYRKNSLIYACVNYRANAAASAAVQIKIGTTPVENHPAKLLVNEPNPLMTEYDFWHTTSAMCDLAGIAYWAKERSRNGRIIGLYPLRPDLVQPVLSKVTGVASYDYTLDGEPRHIPVQDVIAFSNFDPLEFFSGTSPAKVASRLIDIDLNVSDYIKVFFQNSAMLRGVLKTKNTLTERESVRIRSRWREQYGGVSNWGDIAVLDSDADYIKMGSSFNEMAFDELDARTEARICMTFGVPPILIGSKIGLDRSTFANYQEARLSFWQDTMAPIFKHFENEFAFGVRGEFGDAPKVEFILDNIPAFAENKIAKMKAGQEAWQTGIMTRNEARKFSGLPLVSDGDIFFDQTQQAPAQPVVNPVSDQGELAIDSNVKKKHVDIQELKAAHAESRDAINTKHELAYLYAVKKLFRQESAKIIAALADSPPLKLKNPTAPQLETKALASIQDIVAYVIQILNDSGSDWKRTFVPLVTALATETIAQVEADFGIAFDNKNPFVLQFVESYVPIFADGIIDTTRNALIDDLIMAGYEEGLGIPELAKLIEGKYAQWGIARATTIARTETGRVANAATFNGLRDVGITRKEWLATNDLRTRPDHAKANHQIQDIDSPFIVGGEKLMYPNDQNASPEQTINCRCTLVPVMNDFLVDLQN